MAGKPLRLKMDRTEIRSTDSKTGGQKGTKLARFDLIPAGPLTELAEHFGRGARKYESRNWEKGYAWGNSFAAMMRHAWQFWGGEDIDAETGSAHLIAVAWHALVLCEFMLKHKSGDDRSHRVRARRARERARERALARKKVAS